MLVAYRWAICTVMNATMSNSMLCPNIEKSLSSGLVWLQQQKLVPQGDARVKFYLVQLTQVFCVLVFYLEKSFYYRSLCIVCHTAVIRLVHGWLPVCVCPYSSSIKHWPFSRQSLRGDLWAATNNIWASILYLLSVLYCLIKSVSRWGPIFGSFISFLSHADSLLSNTE